MIYDGQKFSARDLMDSIAELSNKNAVGYAAIQIAKYGAESSARRLDESVRSNGFRTAYKFCWKYNLPGISGKIDFEVYQLEYYYKQLCAMKNPKFSKQQEDAARLSYYFAQYIWCFNNKLFHSDFYKNLSPYWDWGFVLRFLLGIGNGYHPKDIDWFVAHHSYVGGRIGAKTKAEADKSFAEQSVFKKWILENYGIDTGCLVLCPEHMEKLRRIVSGGMPPYAVQVLQNFFSRAIIRM